MARKTTNSNRSKNKSSKAASAPAKTTAAKAQAADVVENAVVVDDTKKSSIPEVKDAKAAATGGAASVADKAADVAKDAKPAAADAVKKAAPSTPPKPKAKTPPARTQAPAPQKQPKRKGGTVPLIFGGLIAGGIGYGAATYLPEYIGTAPTENPLVATVEAQSADLETLKAQLADVAARPQAPDLTDGVDALGGQLTAVQDQLAGVSSNLTGLVDRIAVLEKRPLNDAVSPEAVAAYEAELAKLREDVTTQSAELQVVAQTAKSEIQAALDAAAAQEAKAVEITRNGLQLAAAGRVQAAIAAGASFAEPLGEMADAGIAIPDVLTANADSGVVTVVALQEAFPDLARAALAAARTNAEPAEGEGGVASFFKAQLGVRSLAPQEGNSADAILSRAQFAVTETRIADALSELETLPDAAKAVFADWKSQADTRTAALAAADALSASLAQN